MALFPELEVQTSYIDKIICLKKFFAFFVTQNFGFQYRGAGKKSPSMSGTSETTNIRFVL